MERLTKLILEYIGINERINGLYAERKKLEADIKAEHEILREKCGKTGKTADEI